MVLPRQFDEPRSRNPFRHVPARADGYCRIAHAMEQQRRDTDRGKDVPNINFIVHCDERHHRSGTRAHSEQPAPPLRESSVPDHARRARGEAEGSAPFASHLLDPRPALLFSRSPREVRRPDPPREAAVHDQRRHARGIGGAEKRAHRTSLRHAKKRRPLRSHRIHHGSHVVHAHLEAGHVRDPIGKASAALVE